MSWMVCFVFKFLLGRGDPGAIGIEVIEYVACSIARFGTIKEDTISALKNGYRLLSPRVTSYVSRYR